MTAPHSDDTGDMASGSPIPGSDTGAGASGRIVLNASFFPLAFLLSFCSLTVVVGATRTRAGWGQTAIDVPPGQHRIRVHVDYLGAFGPAEDVVPVRPGESVTVHYRAPAVMFLKGALGPSRPATPGAWIPIALAALLLIPVIVAAVGLSTAVPTSTGSLSAPPRSTAPTAAAPPTAAARDADWFEVAGSYDIAAESEDGYRIEGTIEVGDPTPITTAPMPDEFVRFDNCGRAVHRPTAADALVPVRWTFTNATPTAGFDVIAVVGVRPVSATDSSSNPSGWAEYDDGQLSCNSVSPTDFFGGGYDLPVGGRVSGEGFVVFRDVYSPGGQQSPFDEVLPQISIFTGLPQVAGQSRIVEFSGPGVDFDRQQQEKAQDGYFQSGAVLLLPVGRAESSPVAYQNTYTNGYR